MSNQFKIANITETYYGTKYAYEKDGIYDTEYTAECIEHGERFCSSFYAPKYYTKLQLLDIGKDIAMCYGGECINVIKGK